jgi:hypothetical protein
VRETLPLIVGDEESEGNEASLGNLARFWILRGLGLRPKTERREEELRSPPLSTLCPPHLLSFRLSFFYTKVTDLKKEHDERGKHQAR